MLGLRPWLSATPATEAPPCEHCCSTRAFICLLYSRRFGTSSVDSLCIVSTISFVDTMPYLSPLLKMRSPFAYVVYDFASRACGDTPSATWRNGKAPTLVCAT